MIPAIKGDRTGRPWVEFGDGGLYSVYVSECAFALPLWDMSDIDHVHRFGLWYKFLLSPRVWLARFILVFALRSLSFVFGVELAFLLEDPTFSIGMISWFIGSAMNLARPVKNFVQAGWTVSVAFKCLLPLTGSGAPEPGVYRCIVWAFFIVSMFVFIASWISIAIPDFGCARIAGAATSQPVVLSRTKAGHGCS